jgi:hypothetical protein
MWPEWWSLWAKWVGLLIGATWCQQIWWLGHGFSMLFPLFDGYWIDTIEKTHPNGWTPCSNPFTSDSTIALSDEILTPWHWNRQNNKLPTQWFWGLIMPAHYYGLQGKRAIINSLHLFTIYYIIHYYYIVLWYHLRWRLNTPNSVKTKNAGIVFGHIIQVVHRWMFWSMTPYLKDTNAQFPMPLSGSWLLTGVPPKSQYIPVSCLGVLSHFRSPEQEKIW